MLDLDGKLLYSQFQGYRMVMVFAPCKIKQTLAIYEIINTQIVYECICFDKYDLRMHITD